MEEIDTEGGGKEVGKEGVMKKGREGGKKEGNLGEGREVR